MERRMQRSEHYPVFQLNFDDITKEQYEIPLSRLLGTPSTNCKLRTEWKGINTTVKNILLREKIETIFELGTYSINELLNIKLISEGRTKTIFNFYSSHVNAEDTTNYELKYSLGQIVKTFGLSDTFEMLFQEFIPNSGINIRSIVKEKDICGGKARISETRIPVWTLVSFRNQRVSDLELLELYPQLTATDLAIAWAYAAIHIEEIEQDIIDVDID
jgi:uncharacterized protein (DUF433 family)